MAKLTPQACKAARALLGWGVRDLAREADVGVATVARYEAGDQMRPDTIEKLKAAFEAAGVEITNGRGTGARLLHG
ncbi:helix-turn-helix transcriptional regulator [Vitreimonas sp.]|uniref:helix-turn-helix domain-containing protein n=1 Tax=Vitreimonas sp. TaxID=3069702 RepID=UPI0032C231AC